MIMPVYIYENEVIDKDNNKLVGEILASFDDKIVIQWNKNKEYMLYKIIGNSNKGLVNLCYMRGFKEYYGLCGRLCGNKCPNNLYK